MLWSPADICFRINIDNQLTCTVKPPGPKGIRLGVDSLTIQLRTALIVEDRSIWEDPNIGWNVQISSQLIIIDLLVVLKLQAQLAPTARKENHRGNVSNEFAGGWAHPSANAHVFREPSLREHAGKLIADNKREVTD